MLTSHYHHCHIFTTLIVLSILNSVLQLNNCTTSLYKVLSDQQCVIVPAVEVQDN